MNKKIIFLSIGFLVVFLGLGIWLFKPFSSKLVKTPLLSSPTTKKVISQIPIDQRPYVILEPKSKLEPKSLGHWVTLTVDNPGDFAKTEYEFEYTNGSLIQGGMGKIDFSTEKLPVAKEIAFGSASKGKYKYDEGVYEGNFAFHLFSTDEEVLLKTDFNLLKVSGTERELSSPDGKAKITLGKNDLKAGDFVIVASTLGLPLPISGQVLAGPYGFYADSVKKLSDSIISFTLEDGESGTVLYFDGQSWKELSNQKINSLGTFVLINN